MMELRACDHNDTPSLGQ